MDVAQFAGSCGENSSAAATSGGLQVNQQVEINGNTDLQNCVQGNDSSCVYSITLSKDPGVYSYQLNVDGQGPDGVFAGGFYLEFEDETGDKYHLELYKHDRAMHYLAYDSSKPAITTFRWQNKSF